MAHRYSSNWISNDEKHPSWDVDHVDRISRYRVLHSTSCRAGWCFRSSFSRYLQVIKSFFFSNTVLRSRPNMVTTGRSIEYLIANTRKQVGISADHQCFFFKSAPCDFFDHQGLVENIAEDGIQLLYAVVFLVKLTVIASYSMLNKLLPFLSLMGECHVLTSNSTAWTIQGGRFHLQSSQRSEFSSVWTGDSARHIYEEEEYEES